MAEFINMMDISDALIERPISFSVKDKHYSIYPPSLGKIQLMSRLFEAIGIDRTGLSVHTFSKMLLTKAEENRGECLRIIAYATLPGSHCLDEELVCARLDRLSCLDKEDIATLIVTILQCDKSSAIMKHFGMDKEAERLKRVMKAKKDNKNTYTFGGKTLWGTLIDSACERYGWTFQYVLWGISYCNLQLLLADQVKTIFLTDDERKNVHVSNDSTIVRADDKDKIKEFIRTQNWK